MNIVHVLFKPGLKPIRWMWYFFLVVLLFVFLFVVSVIYNPYNLFGTIPELKVLENPKSEVASELYSEDGQVLGKYFRSNRTPVPYDSISPKVIQTLQATEDVRYFNHHGLDLRGLASIPFYLVLGKRKGASTITQQLAKNLYKTRKEESKGVLSDVSQLGTVIIKVKEWITAVRLEKAYTKKEIITMYLNTVDFGANSFGIKVAAKTFFGKQQQDLTWREAAVLIGLLKAPTAYSPVINPESALFRRNTVLNQLAKYQFVPLDSVLQWKKTAIQLSYQVENQNKGLAPYFRAIASRFLRNWCSENGYDLYEDGLKIYTTINAKMQQHAENAVEKHMQYLQEEFFKEWKSYKPWAKGYEKLDSLSVLDDAVVWTQMKRTEQYRLAVEKYGREDTAAIKKELSTPKPLKLFSWDGGTKDTLMSPLAQVAYHLRFLHTGFMSMDPSTGGIKAWVGGINFRHFKYDHVKQGKRQPGSCFKPIIYATVLEEAGDVYSPCYKAKDEPVSFVLKSGKKDILEEEDKTSTKKRTSIRQNGATEGNIWTPQNAENKYSGNYYTLRQALARSINSITALMMKSLGERTPEEVLNYTKKLGFTSNIEATPSMCLGVYDVSLYELVGAYGTFVNKGTWIEPNYISRIEDKYGNVLQNFSPEKRKVLSEEAAYKMFYMLKGGVEEKGGTGLGLHWYKGVTQNNEIGSKTGTTQDNTDGWFMCTMPNQVVGCWVGGDHRKVRFKSIRLGQGARMALPIVGNYLQEVYADTVLSFPKLAYQKPEKMKGYDCSSNADDDTEETEIQDFMNDDNLDDELE